MKNFLFKECLILGFAGLMLVSPIYAEEAFVTKTTPLLDASSKEPKVIYNTDNRIEVFQAINTAQKAAKAVVALVKTNDLRRLDNGAYRFKHVEPVGRERSWCPSERFFEQPAPAYCTGFMVGEDLIATAGHCIKKSAGQSCGDVSFIFDFDVKRNGNARTVFAERDVYQCKEVLGGELSSSTKSDWRVVRVAKIKGREPVQIRREGKVDSGESLTVIGHPVGLPKKIASGATVKQNHQSVYFVTDLDTYGGNSGSPVFNTESIRRGQPMVEGILVRGATDFVRARGRSCVVSNFCDSFGGESCGGESVTRMSQVSVPIPLITATAPVEPSPPTAPAPAPARPGQECAVSDDVRTDETAFLNPIIELLEGCAP